MSSTLYTSEDLNSPLNYMEVDGLFFLDNPLAVMFAATRNLPVATQDADAIASLCNAAGVEFMFDTADLSIPETASFHSAAVAVLSK